jgi:NAD(P)-dependent dehydrogenase (short-subunit alcohol dehydrogenase family)
VVTVSSIAHRSGTIDFDDRNWERKPYRAWAAYGQSKLANLLFTAELQRPLEAVGSDLRATAAHPGYMATNLQFRSERRSLDLLMSIGNRLFAHDAEHGALPILYAALDDVPGNSYAGPGRFLEQRGPKLVGRSQARRTGMSPADSGSSRRSQLALALRSAWNELRPTDPPGSRGTDRASRTARTGRRDA